MSTDPTADAVALIDGDMARAATMRMLFLASPMTDIRPSDRARSPTYADMFTSMCDLRTAANLARGVPATHITGLGYPDLAYLRVQRARRPAGGG